MGRAVRLIDRYIYWHKFDWTELGGQQCSKKRGSLEEGSTGGWDRISGVLRWWLHWHVRSIAVTGLSAHEVKINNQRLELAVSLPHPQPSENCQDNIIGIHGGEYIQFWGYWLFQPASLNSAPPIWRSSKARRGSQRPWKKASIDFYHTKHRNFYTKEKLQAKLKANDKLIKIFIIYIASS